MKNKKIEAGSLHFIERGKIPNSAVEQLSGIRIRDEQFANSSPRFVKAITCGNSYRFRVQPELRVRLTILDKEVAKCQEDCRSTDEIADRSDCFPVHV